MEKIIIHLLALITPKAEAHVGYVVSQTDFKNNLGSDPSFLLSPLGDIKNIFLIFVTIVGVFLLYFLAWKIKKVRSWIIALRTRLDTYNEYIPWILRLSLGIAFMGAASAQVLISPTFPHMGYAAIELVLGFALLAGAFIVPISITGIILFISAVFQKMYLFGNAEIIAALIALLILGSARPGLDDLFGIPQLRVTPLKKYIPLLLRIGLGGALVFLALYEKVLNPHLSELVVTTYGLNTIIPVGASMWVFAVGTIEFFVGLFILLGFQTRLVTAVAFMVIIVTFFFFKEEVYSHVTLFGVLSALFITGGGACSIDYLFKRKVIN